MFEKLHNYLVNCRNLYNNVEDVPIQVIIEIENLEYFSLKKEFENIKNNYSNILGFLIISSDKYELFIFYSEEEASKWSEEVQIKSFKNGFNSYNPFSTGRFFRIDEKIDDSVLI